MHLRILSWEKKNNTAKNIMLCQSILRKITVQNQQSVYQIQSNVLTHTNTFRSLPLPSPHFHSHSHSHETGVAIPILMGFPWDPWGPMGSPNVDSSLVRTITSERLNIGRSNLALRYAVQKSRPSSKVKVKGQGHQGQKTKNCWVIPIDNA